MLTALGSALFASASYDEAAERLCAASDLNPAAEQPYLFLGKVQIASPKQLPCVEQRLARFLTLQPDNSTANYLYAMALWRRQEVAGQAKDPQITQQTEALLTKAATLDRKCFDAYLQLGIMAFEKHEYEQAEALYKQAIEANPQLSEAHYRLGVAYDRLGDHAEAKQEFELHAQIEKAQTAVVEKQRRDVKQFQITLQDEPAPPKKF